MEQFDYVLLTMTLLGAVVFVALYFVDAGYGKKISPKWGPIFRPLPDWLVFKVMKRLEKFK